MTDDRIMVRMAELAVSKDPGQRLVSLGLGSCIGLALVDRSAGVAGLVHIVLPQSWSSAKGDANPSKFADTAVPLLIDEVVRKGACKPRLEAVMCGGAQMFASVGGSGSSALEIGKRNAEETTAALQKAGIRVRGRDTGGNSGRSVEVDVASGQVHVRAVGKTATTI